jgi:hypothetical protein
MANSFDPLKPTQHWLSVLAELPIPKNSAFSMRLREKDDLATMFAAHRFCQFTP